DSDSGGGAGATSISPVVSADAGASRSVTSVRPDASSSRFAASRFSCSAFFKASIRRLTASTSYRSSDLLLALEKSPVLAQVAVQAGITDHKRPQEDHQLSLSMLLRTALEEFAEAGNFGKDRCVRPVDLVGVLHQPAEHGDLPAVQAQDRLHLAYPELGDAGVHGQLRIRILDKADHAGNRRPVVEDDRVIGVDLRRYRHGHAHGDGLRLGLEGGEY